MLDPTKNRLNNTLKADYIRYRIELEREFIVIAPQNSPASVRVVGSRKGSADDAGQEGPLGGADAGLSQQPAPRRDCFGVR